MTFNWVNLEYCLLGFWRGITKKWENLMNNCKIKDELN